MREDFEISSVVNTLLFDSGQVRQRVNYRQLLIGFSVLTLGALFYYLFRSSEHTYFLKKLGISSQPISILPPVLLTIGNTLPSFLHVFAFIMMTAGLIANKKRGYLIVCLSWFTIDVFFEISQGLDAVLIPVIPNWFSHLFLLENTRDYLLYGSFDYLDLVAIALGSIVAYLFLTKNERGDSMKSKFVALVKFFSLAGIAVLGIVTIIASNDGGSGHGDVPPPDTSATAGLWHGTLTDDGTLTLPDFGGGAPIINTFSLVGITSTDGQFRFVIDDDACIGTQFEGTYSLDGNTGSGDFTGYDDGLCSFNNNPEGVISGTIEFTVAENILTGTYVSQDASGTFSLTYDPQVETPLTLAELEGTWVAEVGEFTEITVSANGSFTGTDIPYGCNVSGQISIIDPDWSITNVSVTKSDCDASNRNGTYSGLGVLVFDQDSQGDLFAIIVSSNTRSDIGFFTPAP